MLNFFHSIQLAVTRIFRENKILLRWEQRHPQSYHMVRKRLAFNEPYGFLFTLGSLVSALFFLSFLALMLGLLYGAPYVAADTRVMNLIAAIRTPELANFFLFFTDLYDPAIVVSFAFVVVIFLGAINRIREIWFFLWGGVVAEIICLLVSITVARARPDLGFALITQGGYSFPSTHAAMSLFFYGMVGYGFLEIFTRWWQRSLTALIVFAVTFLVGISRMILGVHWGSDVVAGWTLGFALLIFWVTLFEEWERFHPVREPMRMSTKNAVLIGLALIIIEGAFIFWYYQTNPLKKEGGVGTYAETEITAPLN